MSAFKDEYLDIPLSWQLELVQTFQELSSSPEELLVEMDKHYAFRFLLQALKCSSKDFLRALELEPGLGVTGMALRKHVIKSAKHWDRAQQETQIHHLKMNLFWLVKGPGKLKRRAEENIEHTLEFLALILQRRRSVPLVNTLEALTEALEITSPASQK
jgi:hypothetical protein